MNENIEFRNAERRNPVDNRDLKPVRFFFNLTGFSPRENTEYQTQNTKFRNTKRRNLVDNRDLNL